MSTRSDIIVQSADNTWKRIYCHHDGYLEHNGKILAENYVSQKLADALVAPGDLSSLDKKCTKPKGHTFDNRKKGYCTYYGRDRGETNVDAKVGSSLSEVWPPADTWTEFTYVWSRMHGKPEGAWYVADADESSQSLVLLTDALAGKDRPHPHVKVPMIGVTLGRHK